MGWLTAFVSDTTMALVEDGALLGSRQLDMGYSGEDHRHKDLSLLRRGPQQRLPPGAHRRRNHWSGPALHHRPRRGYPRPGRFHQALVHRPRPFAHRVAHETGPQHHAFSPGTGGVVRAVGDRPRSLGHRREGGRAPGLHAARRQVPRQGEGLPRRPGRIPRGAGRELDWPSSSRAIPP